MSAASDQTTRFETQRQRWLKYGGNVVLMLVLAVGIGAALIYLAQRPGARARVDTTGSGLYSLRPQTINIIRELDQPIELVSLYSTQVSRGVALSARSQERQRRRQLTAEEEFARVRDLLQEYARKGRNITVQIIDPHREEQKVAALIDRVVQKYGGETKAHRDFIEQYTDLARRIQEAGAAEAAQMQALQIDQLLQGGGNDREQVVAALLYVRDTLRTSLDEVGKAVDRRLGENPPDYRGAASQIGRALDAVAQNLDAAVQILQTRATTQAVTAPVSAYSRGLAERLQALRDDARKLRDEEQTLGELKLDEFRQSLTQRDMILVLGPDDMRMINYEAVWPTDMRDVMRVSSAEEIKPRFAGEQQVTSAILSLTRKERPKVAFVRNGGPPVTDPGFPPFQRPGVLSAIAERLRAYNFDVVEKDLTGAWAMQAQMRQMPSPPEPELEEIKDAIWIVLATPSEMMPGLGPQAMPQVLEHVNNGGSAMILCSPQGPDMSELLESWGIEVRTDAIAVHPELRPTGAVRDQIDNLRGVPFIWIMDRYGEHAMTGPLTSLDSIFVGPVALKLAGEQPEGVERWVLGSLASPPTGWGETSFDDDAIFSPRYDESADVGGELLMGVAARKGESRLVVFPTAALVRNDVLQVPDEGLLERGIYAARFPGNAELFTNAVFWLADLETMIAISPSAMDVSRISGLSEPARRWWGIGVLWGGLPTLVIAAGVMVYFARRD